MDAIARRSWCFAKERRVRLRREYQRAQKSGVRVHSAHFVFVLVTNDGGAFRLGLVVSRKVGCAVERNRVKRLLRECFRTWDRPLAGGVDLVIIAKSGGGGLALEHVRAEWMQVWSALERKAIALRATEEAQ